MRRVLTWGTAIGLAVLLFALWPRRDQTLAEGPTLSGRQAEWHPGEVSAPRADRTPAEVTPSGVVVDEPHAEEGGGSLDSKSTGDLVGYLFDTDGSVRGGDRIGLAKSPPDPLAPPMSSRFATTDEDGYFEFQGVPTGAWDVYWSEKVDGNSMASALLGTATIREGQTERRDFVLPGTRTLTGAFVCQDYPESILWLELRFANAPDQVAARGTTETPVGEHGGGEPELDDPDWIEGLDPGDAARRPDPTPGSFRFQNLSAEAYVLRVQLGTDEQGRGIYLEREVDLTLGDVALAPEEIEAAEFLLATMERRGDL